MSKVVVRDLVGDYECSGNIVRAPLQQTPTEVDVLTRRRERVEGIEPWYDCDVPLIRSPVALKSFSRLPHPIGHEPVLLDVYVRRNLFVQPLAKPFARLELVITRPLR
jgi:hypothetical protein